MATYKVYKETTLPGTLQPHSIYLVAPAAHPGYLEVYVSDAAGTASRRTHKVEDIQAMIDSSLAGMSGGATIVDTIAARNALTPSNGLTVLVVDASADPTVDSGAATYVYREANTTWVKISEYESMDVSLTWSNIIGRPTSAVADIDAAVSQRHTHTNMTQLNKVGEDGNGDITYNGLNVAPRLTTTNW